MLQNILTYNNKNGKIYHYNTIARILHATNPAKYNNPNSTQKLQPI